MEDEIHLPACEEGITRIQHEIDRILGVIPNEIRNLEQQ